MTTPDLPNNVQVGEQGHVSHHNIIHDFVEAVPATYATVVNAATRQEERHARLTGVEPVVGASKGFVNRYNRRSLVRTVDVVAGATVSTIFRGAIPIIGPFSVSPSVGLRFTARNNALATFHMAELRAFNGSGTDPQIRFGPVTNLVGSTFFSGGTTGLALTASLAANGDLTLTIKNNTTDIYRVIVDMDALDTRVDTSMPIYSSEFYAWWGDSLTVGGALTSWARLRDLSGIGVSNRGASGDTSANIASRAMGIRTELLAPVTLPTTGTVPISVQHDRTSNPQTFKAAFIGGRLGVLYEANGQRIFELVTPGPVVTVPAGTQVFYTAPDATSEMIEIVWAGTNDGAMPVEESVANVRGIVQRNRRDQVLVIGSIANSTNFAGSAAHTKELQRNAAFSAAFGPTFLDIWAYLKTAQALTDAGITATAGDNEDIANGVIPRSLRSDDLHLSNAGYQLVGDRAFAALTTLGFLY